MGLIPGQATKIPHAIQCSQKKQEQQKNIFQNVRTYSFQELFLKIMLKLQELNKEARILFKYRTQHEQGEMWL